MPPDIAVRGLEVTARTQCSHWHSERDIIAIKHKCCGEYYACISCHEALADHPNQVWPKGEQGIAKGVLCGNCHHELTIVEYLGSGNRCTKCAAEFNAGCRLHYDLYFEV
ncbi:CHY zinc finger family protein [Pseudomassariella vexata]|uniref:CHY zinc finger family protein n=1 Tax=Pseudomassariella vexata TaxID=1141098 RepID=A0A1Y2E897_9PEZI|nr:CHY zinc finger family protein [Pseudomassariella vexata]ORY67788.1 CHY zinc finger family protein [Pseudomassariella vexata]